MGKFLILSKGFCDVEGKVKYSSKKAARSACSSLNDITPYYCPHCRGYHVTTKRNKFFNGTLQHMPSTKKSEKTVGIVKEY